MPSIFVGARKYSKCYEMSFGISIKIGSFLLKDLRLSFSKVIILIDIS